MSDYDRTHTILPNGRCQQHPNGCMLTPDAFPDKPVSEHPWCPKCLRTFQSAERDFKPCDHPFHRLPVSERPSVSELRKAAHESVCEAPDYAIWPRCEGWRGTCEEAHTAIDALARRLLAERDEAREWAVKSVREVEAREKIMTCVWCAHEYAPMTPKAQAPILYEHAKICEKNPARQLEQRIASLERENESLRRFKASVDEALNSGDGAYRP